MNLQDTVYNWLTIKAVCSKRPSDHAAKETYELFEAMLTNDYGVKDLSVTKEEAYYEVTLQKNEETKTYRFPVELVDYLHEQIDEYRNYYDIEKTEG